MQCPVRTGRRPVQPRRWCRGEGGKGRRIPRRTCRTSGTGRLRHRLRRPQRDTGRVAHSASFLPVAALIVAAAALFREQLQQMVVGPKIQFDYREDRDREAFALPDHFAVYLLLGVRNRGLSQAQQVEILVSEVRIDGVRIPYPEGPLKWSSSRESALVIPPGVTRRVDIIDYHIPLDRAGTPNKELDSDRAFLRLALLRQGQGDTPSERHDIPNGVVEIHVVAAGPNIRPTKAVIEVRVERPHTLPSTPDEAARHFSII